MITTAGEMKAGRAPRDAASIVSYISLAFLIIQRPDFWSFLWLIASVSTSGLRVSFHWILRSAGLSRAHTWLSQLVRIWLRLTSWLWIEMRFEVTTNVSDAAMISSSAATYLGDFL